MKRTLIVATTSYAGMGPYVSEIVNTFSPDEDVWFLFYDYEDNFFLRNVKEVLHGKSIFYKKANNKWNKLVAIFKDDFRFENLLFDICKKHRIECVHYINGPVQKNVARKLESLGIFILGTVHDLHPHESKKAPHKMLRSRILTNRIQESMEYNANLVTNGMAQYEELKSLYPQKDIFFHAFPSLVTRSIISGNEIPSELQDIDKPYILFFGRIEEYKGVKLLYETFCTTPDLKQNYYLVIAGKGDLGFERVKDEKNVIWLHRYIKDSEVRYLYENAKCVVYPYLSATQSGVLSLAFYFKTPVLASDVPFFKSSIEQTGAGMTFRTKDVADLKNKLVSLLNSDVREIKSAEWKYYHDNYDAHSIHSALTGIYDTLSLRVNTHFQRMGGAIKSRKQLRQWIMADFDSYQMEHPFAARFTFGENWDLFAYMRTLRCLEYYTNKSGKYPWDKMLRTYYWLKHRHNCKKQDIFIPINCVGPGFHLQHRGFRLLNSNTNIGANCEILPVTLTGNKSPELHGGTIKIGDNCYIATGVTILGPINIGNNVTIAAGAVVNKDIPDNSIVGGVPAKLLKTKD